jgi:hypothetical protein
MKTILTFVDPSKQFNKEHRELTKIQIDNSLELGWNPEDIILATNFPWEYRGVSAYLVPDDCFYGKNNFIRSTKIPVINQLFKDGIIKENEIYWFRDNDAFQLEPIDEQKLKEELHGACVGITDHGWTKKFNAGSFFFDNRAKEIFIKTRECMDERNLDEQDALQYLIDNNLVTGIKKLNLTYNFGIYYHVRTKKIVRKPIVVAHFHPHKQRHLDLYAPLITKRLINILQSYGLKPTN